MEQMPAQEEQEERSTIKLVKTSWGKRRNGGSGTMSSLYSDALEQEYPSECREIREDERRKTIAEFRDAFNKTLKILNEEPCETCKHDERDPLKAPCVYCMYAKNSMWEQK